MKATRLTVTHASTLVLIRWPWKSDPILSVSDQLIILDPWPPHCFSLSSCFVEDYNVLQSSPHSWWVHKGCERVGEGLYSCLCPTCFLSFSVDSLLLSYSVLSSSSLLLVVSFSVLCCFLIRAHLLFSAAACNSVGYYEDQWVNTVKHWKRVSCIM